ncbi:MAG: efflux RND transporter periplasmic adaptor subunit, partial [Paludibacteraceae bacterium]|nr:efflux RND transporter periplasmic adaptor subunit [Paludibacteraceae bacterium]
KGDTLVSIYSPEVAAKMEQAQAARAAAEAQHQKALHGAREEQIEGAYELYQKAKTGREIYEKSFERVQRLYEKGVITLQKRDETEAQYKAAAATEKAALSQYNMALKGAQEEDKAAAKALVDRVDGVIREVELAEEERYLTSPIDGVISGIFPNVGELVGQGSPVMSVIDMTDMWFVFSVREDLLEGFGVGSEWFVQVPALGKRTYRVKISHIKAMASYATWRATKSNDRYDTRTFEVKARPMEKIEGLLPGMTAIITEQIDKK